MVDNTVCGYANHDTFQVVVTIDNTYEMYLQKVEFLKRKKFTKSSVKTFAKRLLSSIDFDAVDWQEVCDDFNSDYEEYHAD